MKQQSDIIASWLMYIKYRMIDPQKKTILNAWTEC